MNTTFRVYYEDTDAGGVVYYANYLKFAERARTELLRSLGISQSDLLKSDKICFVVHSCNAEFLKSAKLDDTIVTQTVVTKIAHTSLEMLQTMHLVGFESAIFRLTSKIACVKQSSEAFLLCKIPESIKQKLMHAKSDQSLNETKN